LLTHLAVNRCVAPSTQNQALAALLFLYREVLDIDLPWLDGVTRATKPMVLSAAVSVNIGIPAGSSAGSFSFPHPVRLGIHVLERCAGPGRRSWRGCGADKQEDDSHGHRQAKAEGAGSIS